MDQFALASELHNAHGGYRETAWKVAGELISDGAEPAALFLDATGNELARRMHEGNEAFAQSRRTP